MFEKLCYFLKFLINKFRDQKCPPYITLINNLPEDKQKYINGSISICHCKGRDCIILIFYFERFYETDRSLYRGVFLWFDD